MDLSLTSSSRFSRQEDLVPAKRLSEVRISVIGVGAIGRQAAIQLAAIGARRLQLVDFDQVDHTNITTQGYLLSDIGDLKVNATARAIAALDPTIAVELVADRFRPKLETGSAVFCCVDSIAAREAIWRSVNSGIAFWADGRMLGEVMRILVACDEPGRRHYPTTFFRASEAESGRCTARSTVYTASIAAGLLVHQFTRWLRGQPIDADATLNLLAGEFVTVGG
jgi:sulfur carrier protein ThiS adenylyltransferase